jgi:hypothetical protein
MALAVLDETGFDRFVSANDTAVIGFIEQQRWARESLAMHRVCPATRRGKLE